MEVSDEEKRRIVKVLGLETEDTIKSKFISQEDLDCYKESIASLVKDTEKEVKRDKMIKQKVGEYSIYSWNENENDKVGQYFFDELDELNVDIVNNLIKDNPDLPIFIENVFKVEMDKDEWASSDYYIPNVKISQHLK